MKNVASLLIGKDKSSGYPGKNVMKINGKPSCEYGLIISKDLGIKNSFVSTDSPKIMRIAKKYDFNIIKRPKSLSQKDSLTEDVLKHAYDYIRSICDFEIIVLLFANNPAISINLVKKGINFLKKNKTYDSAFSVSKYNMFSPIRARKIEKGQIKPFVPLTQFKNINSIRSSQGDVFFCDLSVQVIRKRVFENMDKGMQPFQWMGKKSFPLYNTYGFDIDEQWQKIAIEQWLKENWHQ